MMSTIGTILLTLLAMALGVVFAAGVMVLLGILLNKTAPDTENKNIDR